MLGVAMSRIVLLDTGSVYSQANIRGLTGTGGMEIQGSLFMVQDWVDVGSGGKTERSVWIWSMEAQIPSQLAWGKF